MTNEEAIYEIKESGLYGNQVHQETLELALSALREQAERDKGCEYCKDELDLESGNCLEPSLFIRGNELIARRYDERDSVAEINLCPMCGRRLEEHHE